MVDPRPSTLQPRMTPLSVLTPYRKNPRIIPDAAVAAVAASLKRFGWQQAIVADPKGVIVAGETRYKAAVLLGLTAAPVVTIPARQARAFRVIDNRTSELTSCDTDLLPDALAGLDDLDIFSFDNVLPLAVTAGKTDPDDIPETPKNPVSRVGDIWTLGEAPPDVRGRHEASPTRLEKISLRRGLSRGNFTRSGLQDFGEV